MTQHDIAPGTPVVARYTGRSLPVEGIYTGPGQGGHTVTFRALDPVSGREETHVHVFQYVEAAA